MDERIAPTFFAESILYRSLQRLHYLSQICGFATFSYSPVIGIYMKAINFICFISFTVLLTCLTIITATQFFEVALTGYKSILLFIGLQFFPSANLFFVCTISVLTFVFSRRFCQLMEDMVKLESTVSHTYSL